MQERVLKFWLAVCPVCFFVFFFVVGEGCVSRNVGSLESIV